MNDHKDMNMKSLNNVYQNDMVLVSTMCNEFDNLTSDNP